MSKLFVEDTSLFAIGDAIREKTGKEELIKLSDMPQEIASIFTGGENPLTTEKNFSRFCFNGARISLFNDGWLKDAKPTDCEQMFNNATYTLDFRLLPQLLDMSEVTNAKQMFYNCRMGNVLHETLPALPTSNIQYWDSFLWLCSDTKTVGGLDLNSAKSTNRMFYQANKIENLTLYNIRISIQIGGGNYYSNVLTEESLVHTIRELCLVTNATLTIGETNLEKIANLYCKVLDFENEKMPFELCESTDEGAMLLTEYALLKGWNIA